MAAAPGRTLPPMRTRKNSDKYIFMDADTYQAAILNIKLPNGVRLLEEDFVHKQMMNMKKKNAFLRKKQEAQERKNKA